MSGRPPPGRLPISGRPAPPGRAPPPPGRPPPPGWLKDGVRLAPCRPAPPPPPNYATHYPPQFRGPTNIGYGSPIPFDRSDVNSKRVAAGVCGILFGGLGIHKFILGFAGTGLVMLLTCIFTCGVMHIIGFIEGIIYLTKTDEDFYQTYIVERRNWF